MSIRQPFRRGLIACVLLSAALSSAALTLGRSRGAALLGRPLDVAIPLTLDNPAQAGELCPQADVFQGDTRINEGRVTARVQPGTGQNAQVRIQSSVLVDEPVVTVYLRLGCKEKFTRRYVLLSEEPGDAPVAAAPAPAAVAAAPAIRQAAPATAAPSAATTTSAATATEAATPPRSSRAERAAARARRAAETAVAPRGAAAGKIEIALPSAQQRVAPAGRAATRTASRGGRPHLTVDMLDFGPERDPQLRATAGLAAAPSTDERVRAQAAALWRSINAQPEDVLRDLERVQALENDVKGLRGLVANNDRTLNDLRTQLSQAQQERTLTLAAIALLALLLAAVVVTWWLRRGEGSSTGEWWRRRDAAADAVAAGTAPVEPAAPGSPLRAGNLDLRVDESMFESLKKPPRVPVMPSAEAMARTQAMKPVSPPIPTPAPTQSPADRRAGPSSFQSSFQSSALASMRMVKAEELVDIQQQADFFMSLGQTEQAIEVLESHIHNNTETSALVWLDLLAIYRALKRRDDYELLRRDFQHQFNAEVPAYDSTPTVSGGLEDYPRALTRIAALWPSPKVMDVIEESIFRKPGGEGAEPFDLEAYRELVMLYNLGREVVQPAPAAAEGDSVSGSHASSFNETSLQPLSVSKHDAAPPPAPGKAAAYDLDSMMDSSPGETGLGELVDLDSLHSMLDSEVEEDPLGPHTTGHEFHDPQVPRPSPRLGLDIDLTAPAGPAADNGIDFELFEPERDTDPGHPGKPGS
ncbi:FimV family protein [Caenimonas terrae]|uniref:FimV family protein n=1 Tax=Caenimonas terrae TaxID=696074 RepID=A0ABW0NIF9_9BURK